MDIMFSIQEKKNKFWKFSELIYKTLFEVICVMQPSPRCDDKEIVNVMPRSLFFSFLFVNLQQHQKPYNLYSLFSIFFSHQTLTLIPQNPSSLGTARPDLVLLLMLGC